MRIFNFTFAFICQSIMFRYFTVLLCILLFGAVQLLFSQETVNIASGRGELILSIQKLVKDNDLKNASVSFFAQKVKSKQIVADLNSDLSLVPASTMKLVTTSAALNVFGSSYKFSTILQYDGEIDSNHTLNGNIYIKGGGDPTLGSALFADSLGQYSFFKYCTQAVSLLGIKKINGSVIADESIFHADVIPSTWTWGDIGNYFGAGACGLSIFDNCYEIEFESGDKPGDSTFIKIVFPEIPYLELKNEVKSSENPNDNSSIFGAPNAYNHIAKGTIPLGQKSFKVKGAIPNPAFLTAIFLDQSLRDSGIIIAERPHTNSNNKNRRKDFYVDQSPKLDSIVYYTNLKSINSYAENLLNHLGLEIKNNSETVFGAQALKEFWQSKGMNTEGLFIADGSGLSRANGITAKQITYILEFMHSSKEFDSFYHSLPIAGKTGSLANMLKGTSAEGNLRAKSGYMSRVRSYAGYVSNKKGEVIAFTFIINNYNCSASAMKQKIEKVISGLVDVE